MCSKALANWANKADMAAVVAFVAVVVASFSYNAFIDVYNAYKIS
jgi:hypothetical protein